MEAILLELKYEYSDALLKLWDKKPSTPRSQIILDAKSTFNEFNDHFNIDYNPISNFFNRCDQSTQRNIVGEYSSNSTKVNYYSNVFEGEREHILLDVSDSFSKFLVNGLNFGIIQWEGNLDQAFEKINKSDYAALYEWMLLAEKHYDLLEEAEDDSSEVSTLKRLLSITRNRIQSELNRIILIGYSNCYVARLMGKGVEGNIPFVTWARPPTVSTFFG